MRLAVELDVRQTGDGFKVVNAGLLEVDRNARAATQSGNDMAKMLAGAGIGAGIAILTKQAIDLGDELSTVSQRTGMAVETLSALKLSATQAGTNLDRVTTAMEQVGRQAVEAVSGNKHLAAVFDAIGISAADLKTKAPRELFEQVARGLNAIKDPAARSAAQMQLLRDSSGELTPFLDNLAKVGMKGVQQAAEDMGAVMSQDAAKAANDLNASIAALRQQTSVSLVGIAKSVNILASAFGDELPKGLAASLNPFNLVQEAVRGLTALFVGAIQGVKGFASVLGTIASGLGGVYDILNKPDFKMSDWATVGKRFGDIWSGIKGDISSTVGKTNDLWDQLFAGTKMDFMGGHKVAPGQDTLGIADPKLRDILGKQGQREDRGAERAAQAEARRLEQLRRSTEALNQFVLAQEKEISQSALLQQSIANETEAMAVRADLERAASDTFQTREVSLQRQISLRTRLLDLERSHAGIESAQRLTAEDYRHLEALEKIKELTQRLQAGIDEKRIKGTARVDPLTGTVTGTGEAREQAQAINRALDAEDESHKQNRLRLEQQTAAEIKQINLDAMRDLNQLLMADWENTNRRILGLTQGINDAIVGGAQEGLSALFEGRSLRGAFDSLAAGVRRSFSDMFAGVLSEWLQKLRQAAVGTPGQWTTDEAGNRVWQPGKAGSAGAAGLYGGLAGAAALYGVVQMGRGGATRGQTMVAGASQGAAIGGQFGGVYGAVAGALIGAVAGVFASANNKALFTVSSSGGRLTVTGAGKAGASEVDAAVQAINATLDGLRASVTSIFDAFPKAIRETFERLKPEDIIGDDVLGATSEFKSKTFFGKLFDSIGFKSMRQRAHGIQGGLSGDQLKHFIDVELPQMFYDAYAPIFEGGLRQLGVTEEKLKELFAKTPGFDPKQALQKLQDFVTVLVGFMDSAEFTKLSGPDLQARAGKEFGATPLDGILKLNDRIKELAYGFDDLLSDEQVARGKQILEVEKERQTAVLQYLYELKQAQDALFKSIDQQMFEIGISGKGPLGQRGALQGQLSDVMGRIGGANTPQELAALGGEAQQLIGRIFELTVKLPEELKGLIDGFKALDDVLKPQMGPGEKLADLSRRITEAGDKMSAATNVDDQISAARELYGLVQERYALERQMLDEINSSLKQMTESINKQIHDFALEAKITALGPDADPKKVANIRIEDLLAQQRSLRDRLGQATTTDEVNRIVAELQQNASALFDLMGKTPEAAAQLTKMLEDVRAQAEAKFKQFTDQIQADNDAIRGRVTAAIGILEAALGGLPDAAKEATDALQLLKDTLAARFTELTDQVIAANQDMMEIIAHILSTLQSGLDGIFSGGGTGGGTGTGGGGGGRNDDIGGNAYAPPGSDMESSRVIVVNLGTPEVNVQLTGTAETLIDTVVARAELRGAQMAVAAVQSSSARRRGF